VPFGIAVAFFAVASGAIWYSLHRAALVDVAGLHDRETITEQQADGDVLEAGRLPLPDFVKDLAPSSTARPGLEFISPVATMVMDGRPMFRWKPLGDSWNYVVRVSRPGSDVVAESGEISSREWIPAADLPSGITYQWQVLARRGAESRMFPQPPETAPRFRVIDSATSQRLRELAEKRGGVHLLLAIEYGKAGLIEDARRELRLELPRSRYPEAVERLIQSLDSTDR
jgi:hypothetical protein